MRTIQEEDEVVEFFAKIGKGYPRLPDIWELGWKWRLARDPLKDATPVNGSPRTFMIKTPAETAEYGVPSLTILYEIDDKDEVVSILAVRLSP